MAEVMTAGQHAERLIVRQALGSASAAALTKNVMPLQPELERFIDDWNWDESLEARVEVYLDGKLVAKAGPAQPFRRMYSTVQERNPLASGEVVEVRVDISKWKYWLRVLLEGLVLELLVVGLFFLLKRRLGRVSAELSEPIEDTARWIQAIARGLPDSAKSVGVLTESKVLEVQNVRASVLALASEITQLEGNLAQIHFDRGRLEMADQVVHDIRSPLGSLSMWISQLKSVSDGEKEQMRLPIRRMQDIANTILQARRLEIAGQKNKSNQDSRAPTTRDLATSRSGEPTLLLPLIEQVVSEKRGQYMNRPSLVIEGPEPKDCYTVCASVIPVELQRVLSNLMDNAAEVIAEDGWIVVKLAEANGKVHIEISDTGKGMSAEEIVRVMEYSESIDKPMGSGMGLMHAQRTLKAWGGRLKMASTPGMGTHVTLELEAARLPVGLVPRLILQAGAPVALIDDDPTVHLLWDARWEALGLNQICPLEHFHQPTELTGRRSRPSDPMPVLYLVDYNLGAGQMTGIDLIVRLGISAQSILVSSRTTAPEIATRCTELGIRRLPKDWSGVIPIEVSTQLKKTSGSAIGQGHPIDPLQSSGVSQPRATLEADI